MKIVALICLRNGELYLRRCLEHLESQGVHTCIIDNGSTDSSLAIAREFQSRGVIRIDELPWEGVFNMRQITIYKEQLSHELDGDWYIHYDVDEIKEAPRPFRNLVEAITEVDRQGYNAINFNEFVFMPEDDDTSYVGRDYVAEMRWYYMHEPKPLFRINAWKNLHAPLDLHTTFGHRAEFEGRLLFPEPFILRHYIALSKSQALAKYAGRIHDADRIKRTSWNDSRVSFTPANFKLPPRSILKEYKGDRVWDTSEPHLYHPFLGPTTNVAPDKPIHTDKKAREAGPAPAPKISDRVLGLFGVRKHQGPPPAPFIVGCPRSGTTMLRLMLDAHPDVAIPPETHFLPTVLQLTSKSTALRKEFSNAVVRSPRWNDFHMEEGAFADRMKRVKPFYLSDGLREFYRLYAERFGKERWGEKTPGYVLHLRKIAAVLPEARFVHIIRDGRDVAASLRKLWWGPGESVEAQAIDWLWRIREARQQSQVCQHYMEVRYEDLVEHPEEELRKICTFLELPFTRRMLAFYKKAGERLDELNTRKRADGSVEVDKAQLLKIHERTHEPANPNRVGRWRTDLTKAEAEQFQQIAGPLLQELQYPLV